MTSELWDIYDINRVKTGRTVDRSKMTEAIANDMIARREYHIIVHVWYKNPRGEFLISKRSPNNELFYFTDKPFWEIGYSDQ